METPNNILELLTKLDIVPKDINLFVEALTHRSFVNERRDIEVKHNERLEFLGDAVLELIISEYLFHTYKERPEGELTSFRAATVKTETLASIGRSLEYGQYLRMSHGEEATGGRDKDYLLANTFEAVLGALYLDQGYKRCEQFISVNLIPIIEKIVEKRLDIDAKTKFQEIAQEKYKMTPTYQVIQEEGPDHDKVFTMSVFVGEKELGQGKGASKQKAEEQAAIIALSNINKND